ncbi:hypothetical protein [Limimaricola hongkongensis]|uniref:Uncharacterized protein n=1 Tax=Limimaricola hongkongensis DSM 17492 TaxID=1122180 RepID=A0A017HD25_9RHOB|nr:hypothetical protein [Limimaricola hongkongensis]EYD72210.1 hypothetical protein Lokhon_01002 [Limimaricola hongkongensis DSM 17492]
MISRILQLLVLIGVVLGVTLPQSSAALSAIRLIDARTVVICTGHGIEAITLDADGNPVEAGAKLPHHCLLVDAVGTAQPPRMPSRPVRAAPVATLSRIDGPALAWRGHDGQPRAPPPA